MSTDPRSRAWLEIDGDALARNVATVRASLGPGTGLVPMVKADAYGLGVARVVERLQALDPWGFGVATVAEGRELRERGVQGPVVVFSPAGLAEIPEAVAADLTLTLSHLRALEAVAEAAVHLPESPDGPGVHLEVDTGMGRAGFDWREVERWGPAAQALHDGGVPWRGIYTHLHSADEAGGDAATGQQVERFRRVLEELRAQPATRTPGFLRHLANSAASLSPVGGEWDLARPGVFLYGGEAGPHAPPPDPVVSLRARVVHRKEVRPGDTVGYGATHTAGAEGVWATVACGYADGWPRALGNRSEVLVRGVRVPVVGRISMDVTVVDISTVPSVSLGEVVTFLGCDGNEAITLDEVSTLAGTISYEILTGFTPRLPRVWV